MIPRKKWACLKLQINITPLNSTNLRRESRLRIWSRNSMSRWSLNPKTQWVRRGGRPVSLPNSSQSGTKTAAVSKSHRVRAHCHLVEVPLVKRHQVWSKTKWVVVHLRKVKITRLAQISLLSHQAMELPWLSRAAPLILWTLTNLFHRREEPTPLTTNFRKNSIPLKRSFKSRRPLIMN